MPQAEIQVSTEAPMTQACFTSLSRRDHMRWWSLDDSLKMTRKQASTDLSWPISTPLLNSQARLTREHVVGNMSLEQAHQKPQQVVPCRCPGQGAFSNCRCSQHSFNLLRHVSDVQVDVSLHHRNGASKDLKISRLIKLITLISLQAGRRLGTKFSPQSCIQTLKGSPQNVKLWRHRVMCTKFLPAVGTIAHASKSELYGNLAERCDLRPAWSLAPEIRLTSRYSLKSPDSEFSLNMKSFAGALALASCLLAVSAGASVNGPTTVTLTSGEHLGPGSLPYSWTYPLFKYYLARYVRYVVCWGH